MAGIEQPVEACALPEESDIDPRARGGSDLGFGRKLVLGPASLATGRPNAKPELDDLHVRSMTTRPWLPLTGRTRVRCSPREHLS